MPRLVFIYIYIYIYKIKRISIKKALDAKVSVLKIKRSRKYDHKKKLFQTIKPSLKINNITHHFKLIET